MVLRVNIGGPAHLYTNAIPAWMMAIGTVTRKSGQIGALVRYQGGAYAQINGATVCPLDKREVVSAMIEARAEESSLAAVGAPGFCGTRVRMRSAR